MTLLCTQNYKIQACILAGLLVIHIRYSSHKMARSSNASKVILEITKKPSLELIRILRTFAPVSNQNLISMVYITIVSTYFFFSFKRHRHTYSPPCFCLIPAQLAPGSIHVQIQMTWNTQKGISLSLSIIA